jgi:competence protein ComEC
MMSLNIHFLDVGHGDCTIVDFPEHFTVIDINNCRTLAKESESELKNKFKPPAPNPFLAGLSALGSPASQRPSLPPTPNPLLAGLSALGSPPPPSPNYFRILAEQAESERKLQEAKDKLTNPIDYLKARFPGRSIFRYIQSHPDMDHMAGIHRLLEEGIGIANFWDTHHCIEKDLDALRTGQVNHDIQDWHTYLTLRRSTGTNPTVLRLKAGDTNNFWTTDGIEIWAPFDHKYYNDPNSDPNALSYVLLIRVGACNILLGGDATEATWKEIYERRKGQFPKIHLLKASHHGRKSGYHMESVKAMNPDVTILSVGELKSKDDASGSYERFSNKGCHSTLDHGDIRATCWEDSEVWLYDRDDNLFLQSFK